MNRSNLLSSLTDMRMNTGQWISRIFLEFDKFGKLLRRQE